MTDDSHIGSSLDELLEEEGILAEVSALALKRVLAWQIAQTMEERGVVRLPWQMPCRPAVQP